MIFAGLDARPTRRFVFVKSKNRRRALVIDRLLSLAPYRVSHYLNSLWKFVARFDSGNYVIQSARGRTVSHSVFCSCSAGAGEMAVFSDVCGNITGT